MAIYNLEIKESFEFIVEQNNSDCKIGVLFNIAYSNKVSIGMWSFRKQIFLVASFTVNSSGNAR